PFAITGLVVALFVLLVAWNIFASNKIAAKAQKKSGAKS
ncbi:hypothetical protein QU870_33650, partial [Escherichia coli]|nr:hypothetical protein [Escherichia coli]